MQIVSGREIRRIWVNPVLGVPVPKQGYLRLAQDILVAPFRRELRIETVNQIQDGIKTSFPFAFPETENSDTSGVAHRRHLRVHMLDIHVVRYTVDAGRKRKILPTDVGVASDRQTESVVHIAAIVRLILPVDRDELPVREHEDDLADLRDAA